MEVGFFQGHISCEGQSQASDPSRGDLVGITTALLCLPRAGTLEPWHPQDAEGTQGVGVRGTSWRRQQAKGLEAGPSKIPPGHGENDPMWYPSLDLQ